MHRRAAAEGRGRIVLIGGEAGIGKSRVLRHFESTIAAGRSMLARARCVEFVQTPLGPLRDLLLQLERRGSAARDGATRSLIERLAFERNADPSATAVPGGSVFESIDAAFARYAARGTVVLLIEDVHWADRSTLAFLTYLADRTERQRILVIATYRSDEVGAQHPRLSEFASLLSKSSVSSITLAPLDERTSRAFVEAALPNPEALPVTTIAGIVKRSQGNPFFAEELLKNALEQRPGAKTAPLPLSIRGAVLARASQLSDADRRTVSLAAVLGERFSIDRLVTLLDDDREAVLRALERARALHLLSTEPAAPGELAFRHALTHEVLYDELLAERVRPLHETIARDLERRPDRDGACVELAHHWRRAGDLHRAAAYDEVAGDQANAIGAFADAMLYYERALAERPRDAELVHKLGVAFGSLDQLGAGIGRLRQAAELFGTARDYEGFTRNASALGAQLYNAGDAQAATTVYREAVDALESRLPAGALDLLRARIAYNCVAALEVDAAETFLAELPQSIGDAVTAVSVQQTRFKIAAMRGDVDRWRREVRTALDAARGLVDGGPTLRQLHTQIALDAIGLGEVAGAREHFRAAMPPRYEGYSSGLTLASAASSFEHTLRGDFAGAAALLDVARAAPEHAYAILVHVKSATFALGNLLRRRPAAAPRRFRDLPLGTAWNTG